MSAYTLLAPVNRKAIRARKSASGRAQYWCITFSLCAGQSEWSRRGILYLYTAHELSIMNKKRSGRCWKITLSCRRNFLCPVHTKPESAAFLHLSFFIHTRYNLRTVCMCAPDSYLLNNEECALPFLDAVITNQKIYSTRRDPLSNFSERSSHLNHTRRWCTRAQLPASWFYSN